MLKFVFILNIDGLHVKETLGSTEEKTLFPFLVNVRVSFFNLNTTANVPNFRVLVSTNRSSYKILAVLQIKKKYL